MSDCTLSDGRQLTINLYQVTTEERRALLNPLLEDEKVYAIVAKIIGWTAKDISNMSCLDYILLERNIAYKFFVKIPRHLL